MTDPVIPKPVKSKLETVGVSTAPSSFTIIGFPPPPPAIATVTSFPIAVADTTDPVKFIFLTCSVITFPSSKIVILLKLEL